MLFDNNTVTAERLLLINDVPNCDQVDVHKKCATSSVDKDTQLWFSFIQKLGLSSFGIWDLFDGGLGDANEYGDAFNDGQNLTRKGLLHSQYISQLWQQQ